METKIKNFLGLAAALAVLSLAYAALSLSSAYSRSIQPSSFRSFSVSGEGKVVAVPDIAQFNFSVISEGEKDLAKIQTENTDKVNKAIAFVKSKAVESKDIKTEGYNLQPRYQYYECRSAVYSSGGSNAKPCPPPEIVGYTITQSVTVKIRDFVKIGVIMSGLVENGANQVGSLNFTIDDRTKVENEARAEAIAKAKEKALAVAKAGGFSLGRLLAIEEGGGFTPYSRYDLAESYGVTAPSVAKVSPTIEPGSQDVKITVSLRYEIKWSTIPLSGVAELVCGRNCIGLIRNN